MCRALLLWTAQKSPIFLKMFVKTGTFVAFKAYYSKNNYWVINSVYNIQRTNYIICSFQRISSILHVSLNLTIYFGLFSIYKSSEKKKSLLLMDKKTISNDTPIITDPVVMETELTIEFRMEKQLSTESARVCIIVPRWYNDDRGVVYRVYHLCRAN